VTAPGAVLLPPSCPQATQAILPVALSNSTVRLALTIGAARNLALGVVPVAVIRHVQREARTMFVNKVGTTSIAAVLAAGMIAAGAALYAYQASPPGPAGTVATKPEAAAVDGPDDGLLAVSGVVRMPDGAPAVGATVRAFTAIEEAPAVTRTDGAGRFQLRAVFGNGCSLHAASADASAQTVHTVASVATRTRFVEPLELTLVPALAHEVTVLSRGNPVSGAHVAAEGPGYEVQGVTGADGKAQLLLPATPRLNTLAAWHPTLGIGGMRDHDQGARARPTPLSQARTTELSLLPPAPLKIRVLEVDGRPVGGLTLGVSARTEDSDWIVSGRIAAAHVRTDAEGMALVPWTPREKLQYVDVDLVAPEWKCDDTDLSRLQAGTVTLHARREVTVQGRVIVPDGADAEGILVSGFGFGPAHTGDIPYTRTRRDGTFRLRVASEHGYVLGISDLRWASDPWSGVIVARDSIQAASITLKAYPATPLTIRVTRGGRREPVAHAWLDLGARAEVNWTDSAGKKRSGMGGVRTWLRTDAVGIARASVGKGKHHLRLVSGDWSEERTIEVSADKPVDVAFHRPWAGTQRMTGRLMSDGAPYAAAPALVARAWASRDLAIPVDFPPVIQPDGTFEVRFDAESVSLFFVDRARERCAFTPRVEGGASITLSMEPMTATYSGTLLDENGQPMAGRTLEFYVRSSQVEAVPAQQTDQAGRFRFAALPADVPLQLAIRREPEQPDYFLFEGPRLFNPGERREHDLLKPQRVGESLPSARASEPVPLAKRLPNLCRNAHACGMRALLALEGSSARDVTEVVDELFDFNNDRMRAIFHYVTLRVSAAQLKSEAASVAAYGWPRPAPGEIVLVVLDGDQKTIAAQPIATNDAGKATETGRTFLEQHRLPAHDALTLLDEARAEAKRSDRRVWVIDGGPRCGPCFRLARWIEDHHTTLARDFVVVKVMEGLDEHVTEALAGLPIKDGDGIPWFAFTEPDGRILAISRGPLGNTGFPTSVEDLRHFRHMLEAGVRRITAEEVDQLIHSLEH
jgi:hypothetical protein